MAGKPPTHFHPVTQVKEDAMGDKSPKNKEKRKNKKVKKPVIAPATTTTSTIPKK